eukprot:GABV01008664.1.p1 GENE.GABV01008664.1~~GABV01008664.1.p1  ORF type:complete len:225 (-),score=16.33 GABV01008664.1:251-925(-)
MELQEMWFFLSRWNDDRLAELLVRHTQGRLAEFHSSAFHGVVYVLSAMYSRPHLASWNSLPLTNWTMPPSLPPDFQEKSFAPPLASLKHLTSPSLNCSTLTMYSVVGPRPSLVDFFRELLQDPARFAGQRWGQLAFSALSRSFPDAFDGLEQPKDLNRNRSAWSRKYLDTWHNVVAVHHLAPEWEDISDLTFVRFKVPDTDTHFGIFLKLKAVGLMAPILVRFS